VQKKVVISAFDEDDVDEPSEYPEYCSCWSDLFSMQQKFPIALLSTDKKLKKIGVASYIEIAKNNKAYAIHPEHTSVDEKLVKLAHNAGLKVNAWTVNDVKIYDRFSEYGVDGVFCDNPSFLVSE
jgi:glycerophosphoryl diester phosphodiesterase